MRNASTFLALLLLLTIFLTAQVPQAPFGQDNFPYMPSAESPDSLYPAWVRYFGPERESVFDKALDLALDNSGNIYVTGTSDGDYLTVKYTSAGRVSWLAHYAGPAYSNDIATTVAVDNAGNVLVSGFSSGTDGDSDYECLTVKYDSSGNELWVAVYDANTTYTEGYDRVSLGSDSAGSVYLTATNRHFLVRYDADGVELWARQISRAMSVVALALDNAGSVYVSGEGSNTTMDYIATARFNAAGEELWIREKENYYLNARDLAVDGLGNVYVTGFGDDYLTVKYDSSGGEQWTATYNGPGNSYDYAEALAVDPAGNVYVTGQSDFGCVTVKYNTAGVEQWVARQTEAQTEQGGRKVLIDANGNVVVAGISHPSGQLNLLDYLTIQYNPAGQENWHHFYSRQDSSYDLVNALAVAPDGAVYLTGMSFGDEDFYNFVTVKYDLAGNEEWAAGYDGPKRSYAGISATATDLQGNVYVTGGCSNENGGWAWPDYATIKYDPDGQELWRAIYNGPANSTDWAKDITVDAAGNVYITGFATLEGGRSTDYLTIKYDAAGQEQWVAAYNGPASSQDYAYALGLDGNGNVYVSGYSRDPTGTNATITTVQYDPSGNEQWVARYLGAFDLFEQKVSLVVDQSGNCYVAGMHFEMTYTDRDFALVKYSSTGVERWAVRYAGPGNGEDSVTDLATDNSGNIYLTGRSVGNGSGSDYATVKYDSTGQELWLARYDGPAGQEDAAAAIELDSSGNIYVTGFSGGFGGADFATVKYDPDGNLLWVERLDGQSGGADMATALTVSAAGRICITGNSEGADGLMDVLTVQYDSEGMVRGLRVFDNPALPDNRVAAIVTGPGEQVYVAGYSGSEKPRSYSPVIGIGNLDSKFALIKYSAGPVAIDVAPTGLPGTFGLSQNYPNPFNHTSVINYHIERAAFVTLAVYNILGQKVATLFEGHRAPGNYRAIFDGRGLASGLYFYSLNSGSSSQTLKLQLVK